MSLLTSMSSLLIRLFTLHVLHKLWMVQHLLFTFFFSVRRNLDSAGTLFWFGPKGPFKICNPQIEKRV